MKKLVFKSKKNNYFGVYFLGLFETFLVLFNRLEGVMQECLLPDGLTEIQTFFFHFVAKLTVTNLSDPIYSFQSIPY